MMNSHIIASRLLLIAKEILALEFDTKKEMEEYRKRHKVRKDTKLTVKSPTRVKNKTVPVKTPKPKTDTKKTFLNDGYDRDEWFDNPTHPDRLLYHGTTKRGLEKIKDSGGLNPHVAEDDREAGNVVWTTTNKEYAQDFASRGGVVFQIRLGDVRNLKHTKFTTIPKDIASQWKKDAINDKDEKSLDLLKQQLHNFEFVIRESIPLSKLKILGKK